MPALDHDMYESLLHEHAKRNLERLSLFKPPSPPPPPPPPASTSAPQPEKTEFEKLSFEFTSAINDTQPLGLRSKMRIWIVTQIASWMGEMGAMFGAPRTTSYGLALKLLKKWSEDNMESINAAKLAQVFGGKGDINWQNSFLPFMESMGMYLRDLNTHRNAWSMYRDFMHGGSKGLAKDAINLYADAYRPIDELAQVWGMRFLPLCDMVDLSPEGHPRWDGPYCGMFFTTEKQQDNPFIGIAFKGTNPANIKEWAVDFNYQLVPSAQEWFAGTQIGVSQGVYTGLFGDFSGKGAPYNQILSGSRDAVSKLPNTSGRAVPVHVTGHSLGGSYSTLCYTQLLIDVAPTNPTPKQMFMGDEYTFGAPRIGSNDWARLTAKLVEVQRGRSWRIVNNLDLVPRVPPTNIHPKQVNFHHVDTGVHIWPYKAPAQLPTEIGKPNPWPYPIYSILFLIPTLVMVLDHLPRRYYESLQFAISGDVMGGRPMMKGGHRQMPNAMNMIRMLFYTVLSYINKVVLAIASVF